MEEEIPIIDNILNNYDFQPNPDIFQKCYTYGVATGRFNSILYLKHQNQYLIPQGLNLSLFSLENNQIIRKNSLKYNQDAIFVCLQNEKYIFSIGFSGQIIVIDKISLNFIKSLKTQGREVRFASVNQYYIVLNSEFDPQNPDQKGIVEIFDIESGNQVSQFYGDYKYSLIYGENQVISVLRNQVQNPQNQTLKNENIITQHIIQEKSSKLDKQINIPLIDEIIYAGQNENYGIFLYTSRSILIVNLKDINQFYLGEIKGSGAILTGNIQNNKFYCVPKNNLLLSINLTQEIFSQLPKIIEIQQQNKEFYQIQEIKSVGISQRNFYLNFQGENDSEFFTFNEDGLTHYSLKEKKQISNLMHSSITCVGLASHPNNSLTAVGDMCGNILIYDTSKYDINNTIIHQGWIPCSIRCLAWSNCGNFVYIGDMDGILHQWEYSNSQEINQILDLDQGTITSIKPNPTNTDYLITTTSGNLFIYEDLKQENPKQKLKFLGHQPVPKEKIPDPSRFGSLHIKAEIWNSCWIDQQNKIATSSEDQCGHIYSLDKENSTIKIDHILSGQALAVTGIDCQQMKNTIGTIYAQCSDDRTIKLYDPLNNFKLIMVLSTHFIHEWHTLTYLALEKGGTRIAISGQSGYLFIFDIEQKKWIYGEKTHLGGIEGLIWQNGQLATCSSDCCLNIYNL